MTNPITFRNRTIDQLQAQIAALQEIKMTNDNEKPITWAELTADEQEALIRASKGWINPNYINYVPLYKAGLVEFGGGITDAGRALLTTDNAATNEKSVSEAAGDELAEVYHCIDDEMLHMLHKYGVPREAINALDLKLWTDHKEALQFAESQRYFALGDDQLAELAAANLRAERAETRGGALLDAVAMMRPLFEHRAELPPCDAERDAKRVLAYVDAALATAPATTDARETDAG